MSASKSQTGDYEAIRKDVVALLRQPDYDDGSIGPVLVRLAWHSAGTYDLETDTGGSNGSGMRYDPEALDPSNAGLHHARLFLQPVKNSHPWISYSDLWTFAAIVAIREMGGPQIPWLPGRTDFVDESKLPPRGRLPDATLGADHVRNVFYRMGFNDQEIVALCGAHNLGRCHVDRSGFEGAWVNNPIRFANTYYKLLSEMQWREKEVEGSGLKQFVYLDEDSGEELMMLPTDMALLSDPAFKVWVLKYAQDRDLFFQDFAAAFSKLMELGIKRDVEGRITNSDLDKGGYHSAPKKPILVPAESSQDPKEDKNSFRARL